MSSGFELMIDLKYCDVSQFFLGKIFTLRGRGSLSFLALEVGKDKEM